MGNKDRRKTGIVVGLFPEQYKISDIRLNKPVCHQKFKMGVLEGSMLVQDIDSVRMNGKELTYFAPNNIGIMLSVSREHTEKAERTFRETFKDKGQVFAFEETTEDRIEFLNRMSSIVCDYIQSVQTALVFGYTALETFANLSVPANYEYLSTTLL